MARRTKLSEPREGHLRHFRRILELARARPERWVWSVPIFHVALFLALGQGAACSIYFLWVLLAVIGAFGFKQTEERSASLLFLAGTFPSWYLLVLLSPEYASRNAYGWLAKLTIFQIINPLAFMFEDDRRLLGTASIVTWLLIAALFVRHSRRSKFFMI